MSRSVGLGHLVSTHGERCASQWLRVELAGWLGVGVGCDMQTKDEEQKSIWTSYVERFCTHFRGVLEPNTCRLEVLGFTAADPIGQLAVN